MSTNKTSKAWNNQDTSIINHLVLWGYNTKEVGEIAIQFLSNRTMQAISCKVGELRKWHSKAKGFIVTNYDLRDSQEKKFKKVAKLLPTEELELFRPNIAKEFIKSNCKQQMIKPKIEVGIQQQPNTFSTPFLSNSNSQIVTEEKPSSLASELKAKEPNILAVMKMAKDLGASEMEYQGMKIKF